MATAPSSDTPDPQRGNARRALTGLALVAALAGGAWGGWWWLRGQYLQSTDDAYLQADSLAVAPKISGYVAQVLVGDNQAVHQGDLLVRLDARKYRAAADETRATIAAREADLARARAELAQQQASIAEASAQAQGAQADLAHAHAQYQRYAPLARSGAETQERLAELANQQAQARSTLAARQAALRSAQARLATQQAQVQQAQAQLGVAQASDTQAALDYDDAEIRAPLDGRVGDRGVRLGQFVQPGTRLLTVVPVQGLYLTANFKETQIGAMRTGQRVSVKVDALPGRELTGWIDSFAPGTGAQFALLPPANATGNFTKIVQRVPVRIRLDVPGDLQGILLPGLSATVEVDTRGDQAHG
ncbi:MULTISPECIES: HlyD family secretion protein [unclassified Pseudomonas]|uniref:HlyD family secretion protein n=1 Tax=unclassified Pseudomonas TaxID=196821 RepID=UPI000BD9E200|nr:MULTISPECIES: HlyD family secretion protein [unclassified Pseudomonas]PVZ20071.1 membrane fusion protein (multidrug efflux system) [Pseudomonas sp. URIL14HWK12:I12]PVZ27137.1 membrane fusion protein (multidrug efflux system) [Pseudomonas sp. URIL14HWK12:I10]PVZ38026.1 membrane fusion protein (multidrug efflux system) [Pseudomonas sp. URIL14HWK12:I11]SNZ04780.1 membrane fusion protein, multidrug efflux system [Pseudomonas sp. URIL14HWK12:I9]